MFITRLFLLPLKMVYFLGNIIRNTHYMKLFKLFLGALLITVLSISSVSAQEANPEPVPITEKAIANVNILDTKIISQDKNVVNIYFKLTNGEGVQTGLKYSVSLISEVKGKKVVADEKVYDESFTLLANESVTKTIEYDAPKLLEGNYSVFVSISNSSGFPFAFSPEIKLTLKSLSKGVYIVPGSCSIFSGYVSSTDKTPDQPIVFPKENLRVECSATNTSTAKVTVMPKTATYSRTGFGSLVDDSQVLQPISFLSKETKKITLNISAPEKPQAYETNFWLVTGDQPSNTMSINYIVRGPSATIQNISLDKDSYTRGDTAKISVVWSGSNDTVMGQVPSGGTLVLSAQMKNSSGLSCGKIEDQNITLDRFSGVTEISVDINSKCETPFVSVTISDTDGKVLAEKNYSSKGGDADMVGPLSKKTVGIILVVLLLILLIAMYTKFKNRSKNQNIQVPPMAIFIIALGLATLLPLGNAQAATFNVGIYGNAFATVYLPNGTTYPVGTNSITVRGTITSTSNPGINNDVSLSVYSEGTNPPSSPSSSVPVIPLQNLPHGNSVTNDINMPTLSVIGDYLAKFTATIDEYPVWNPHHVFFTGNFRWGKVHYTGPANHTDLITVRVQLHGTVVPGGTTGVHVPDTIFYIRPNDTNSYLNISGGTPCGSGNSEGCEIEGTGGFVYGVVTSITSSTNQQLDNYIPSPWHVCRYAEDPYPDGNYFAELSQYTCADRHPGSTQYQ